MLRDSKVITDRLPYDTEAMSEEGIDLVAVVVAVLAEWKVGLLAFVVLAGLGLAYVASLRPQYVASASFLPSEGHTEASSLASIFNASGPGTLYLGLMRSRSVEDDVIDHARLLQLFGTSSYEAARGLLASKSSFIQGADSIITVTVRDENAQNAAMIANAYLTGLQNLNDKMAQSQSAQSQRLFEKQLTSARQELKTAETALIALQERTGQVAPGAQAGEGIGNIAGYSSQLAGLRVQLAQALESETENNPDVQRIRSQMAQLEREEREQESGRDTGRVGAPIPANRIPILNQELAHAQAEVDDRRAAVAGLSGQYGSARADANLSHPAFQVIDKAIPPEGRAWPPRQAYQLAALGFAAIASLFVVLLVMVGKRIWTNPDHRASLYRLRGAL